MWTKPRPLADGHGPLPTHDLLRRQPDSYRKPVVVNGASSDIAPATRLDSMTAASAVVGVVVPTRNSARTLRACLLSLRHQQLRPSIVVVDNHSTDATLLIAQELADVCVVAGPERSAQRNRGAALLVDADVLGFVDSDMVVKPDVVAQVATQVAAGTDAVVVPEHSIGPGFVARIRAFDRAQYVGISQVEAARFFTRAMFDADGGFDEALTAGENWDLALRVLQAGATVGHVRACIRHDEARVGFLTHCAKKGRSATGLRLFLAKHGDQGKAVVLDRPYLHRPWTLLRHPMLGSRLVLLKAGEAVAVLAALASEAMSGALHLPVTGPGAVAAVPKSPKHRDPPTRPADAAKLPRRHSRRLGVLPRRLAWKHGKDLVK